MIQRLQSLWLFIAGIFTALLFHDGLKFSALKDQSDHILQAASNTSFSDGIFTLDDHLFLIIAGALAVFLIVITIFLFKRRTLQIKISKVVLFVLLLLNGLAFYLMFNELNLINQNADVDLAVKPGAFLPFLSILFVYLAIRYINKDEKLVKSMDRLR